MKESNKMENRSAIEQADLEIRVMGEIVGIVSSGARGGAHGADQLDTLECAASAIIAAVASMRAARAQIALDKTNAFYARGF